MIESPQANEKKQSAAHYALDLCARTAACTETSGSITRLFLAPSTHQVHAILREEMEHLGMTVRIDGAGNLRGLFPAAKANAPVLLTGSHVDTVPDAGPFDGVLGVAIPLAVLRGLNGQRLPYAIEIIAFSEEEGIRFKMPFIGSRAVIGTLTAEDLALTDADGISIAQALKTFGLDASPSAPLTPNTFAFLEVHIEQGPILEALNLPLGVVTAIVGQTRLELTFTGRANHAGTTPMHLRQDALAAASAWISIVEHHACNIPGLVATVGTIRVAPGAANVIPGLAIISLDIRHATDAMREKAVAELLAEAHREATTRNVTLAAKETSQQPAISMDERLCAALAQATESNGNIAHRMTSGAGHDAMILAAKVPATMLFVRTPAGLSHHPDEAVAAPDVQAAIEVITTFLKLLEPNQ